VTGLLHDKVCVITGGAGSIGLASARLFLEQGARGVVLVDLHEHDLHRASQDLPADRVACVAADVTQADQVCGFIAAARERWGGIDVLFSNAGNAGVVAPLASYPEEVFDSVLAVHVRGAFLVCKYGLPAVRDGGSIIITSSVAGVIGAEGVYAYVTAKHAQVGLMRCVSKEAAHRNIRVNTLHPGPVANEFQLGIEKQISGAIQRDATKMFDEQIPLGRHATAQEIANSALFLASDLSTFTTGSLLMADGGLSV
jgi:NAD(P)-dependent dehydrogenase (short-subunit alcohol dehydrogenase family)